MSIFIKSISIKGIKNIENTIKLEFAKKDAKSMDELRDYNIKSIYGPNGAGKTAIVHAFSILTNLSVNDNYLTDSNNLNYLNELINKNTNKLELDLEFYYENKHTEELIICNYLINLEKTNHDIQIVKEVFYYRNSEYSKDNIIYKINEGVIEFTKLNKTNQNIFINLLDKRSYFNVFLKNYAGLKNDIDIDYHKNDLHPILSFLITTLVFLDHNDKHQQVKKEVKNTFTKLEEKLSYTNRIVSIENKYSNRRYMKESLNRLKKNNDKKTMFLKIFKPNIVSIDIVERLISSSSEEEVYEVSEFINYGDYRINLEFESMGIKKIFNLYNSLEHLSQGGILIIDELDSHINDVYLEKIIEYVYQYTKGQLIFTTHNLTPMNILRKRKLSIDFMSIDGIITPWVQVGNYSPSNLYKSGMIDGLPFNISAESFLKVYNNE